MFHTAAVSRIEHTKNHVQPSIKSKPSILIVDDELPLVLSMQRQLRADFRIETALNATQALHILITRGPFAAIVSDMHMPHVNGVNFFKYVKTLMPETIRIMLTGDHDVHTAMQAINEGDVYRYFKKPLAAESLKNVLNEAIVEHDRARTPIEVSAQVLETLQNDLCPSLHDILGYASYLSEDRSNPEPIKNYARLVLKQAGIINASSRALQTLLSIKQGKRKLECNIIKSRDIFVGLRERKKQLLREKALKIEARIGLGASRLNVDFKLLEQALDLLLSQFIETASLSGNKKIQLTLRQLPGEGPIFELSMTGKDVYDSASSLVCHLAQAVSELHGGRFVIETEANNRVRALMKLSPKSLPPVSAP